VIASYRMISVRADPQTVFDAENGRNWGQLTETRRHRLQYIGGWQTKQVVS